jgi:DNA repair photolyase
VGSNLAVTPTSTLQHFNTSTLLAYEVQVKSILNKTKRRDPWFLDDYTLNPYSGCSFNCLYCYIRGSKYGIHMEEKLSVKVNALELLEKVLILRSKKGQNGIIALSSSTDPYLQIEKDYLLTRRILELILNYRFPVHIITKSDLVIRDFDLLREIDKHAILPRDLQNKLTHKVFITFSFSTLDDKIGKLFEPGATPPSLRLLMLHRALQEGFHSGVSLMPLLPYISDTPEQLEEMFEIFKRHGTRYIFPASITLFGDGPADSKTLVFEAVRKYDPALLEKYKDLFVRGFEVPYGYSKELERRTTLLSEKYGIKNRLF